MVLASTGSAVHVTHVPHHQIFSERTDVTGRVPGLSRLQEMVGATAWLPVADIIDEMLHCPNAEPHGRRPGGPARKPMTAQEALYFMVMVTRRERTSARPRIDQ
ncbi:hypothetical protein ACFVH0_00365 [Streptomyces sp. NPDC127117]|uniref:hypothetical protein n=1 Tax=Streptomyces sp. NPDC127117 TaxID=3345368 RepID=UPI0036405099